MIRNDFKYKFLVYRAVDGDTLDGLALTADHGLYRWEMAPVRVRLLDIDTWEKFKGDHRDKGRAAMEYAWSLFQSECRINWCTFVTHKDKEGKYGRFLGEIFLPKKGLPDGLFGRTAQVIDPLTGDWSIRLHVALRMAGFEKV